jgi:hypothetical protein
MEMTAAGLLPAVVVDDWIARLWVQIIKGLKLHPRAVLREGGEIAWGVRPDNPKLLETLNRAIAEMDGNALKWASHTKNYLAKLKQLHSATQGADMQISVRYALAARARLSGVPPRPKYPQPRWCDRHYATDAHDRPNSRRR